MAFGTLSMTVGELVMKLRMDTTLLPAAMAQVTRQMQQLGVSTGGVNTQLTQTATAAKKAGKEIDQIGNYVKRAAIAFAAYKGLDIIRDFTDGCVEGAKQAENFGNALKAALPAGETFRGTLYAMSQSMRGLVPQYEQMRLATLMYASGLAKTNQEAAGLAEAGTILTTIFAGQNATWDKYMRLLQGGSKMLYDNFSLSMQTIDAYTNQIMVTEGLSKSEAKIIAVRRAVLEQADKFRGSIGELNRAMRESESAMTDYQTKVGQTLTPLLIAANMALTDLTRAQIDELAQAQRAVGITEDNTDAWRALVVVLSQLDPKLGFVVDWMDATQKGMQLIADTTNQGRYAFRQYAEDAEWAARKAQSFTDTLRAEPLDLTQSKGLNDPKPWYDYAQAVDRSVDSVTSKIPEIATVARYTSNEFLGVLSDWSAGLGEFVGDTQDSIEAIKESYFSFVSDFGGIFTDLKELQEDYNKSVSDAYSGAGGAEAAEKKKDAAKSLKEDLVKLEQEQAEKIAWVRTGAWKRTQQEEAEAEAWWNAEFDRKIAAVTQSYADQVSAIDEGEREKNAKIASRVAEETKQYEEHLQHLKLVAALTVLEMNGQLSNYIGPVAKNAADAAALIESGIIPVTDKLAGAIAGASESVSVAQADAAKQSEANMKAVSDATTGKIEGEINPAIVGMGGAFTTTADSLAKDAVAIGSTLTGVQNRINDDVVGAVNNLLARFAGNSVVMQHILATLKKKFGENLQVPLEESKIKATDASDAITRMNDDNVEPLKKLLTNLNEVQGALKNIETEADAAGTAVGEMSGRVLVTPTTLTTADIAVGHANGGTFVVPPGYPNDSYPMLVESGEVVSVIPRSKVQGFAQGTGVGELAPIDSTILNVWLPVAQAQFRKRLNKMFDLEPITEYFTELRDLQAQMVEDEQEYQDVIAGIQSDALTDLKDERKDYDEKVTASEAERQEKIKALDADAWGITQEQYAVELAAINTTYDEKKKVMLAAYKEQIAIIKAAEAAKLVEEQAAYAKSQEEYKANLDHLKLVAGLSVLEMSGTLQSFTNGWADTADEAASLIETGLLPISTKLAGALSTSMKGLVGTTTQADAALIKNNKVLANIMAGNYTAMASPTAGLSQVFQEFTGGTAEDTLKNTIGSIITSMTGDVRTFLEYFGVKDIDKMLGHFTSSGGHANQSSAAITTGGGSAYPAWAMYGATGADFIVPPGYARDTFPMYVSSGEHVQVTPAGQGNGRNTTINVTGNWNPQTEGDLMRYLKIINLMG